MAKGTEFIKAAVQKDNAEQYEEALTLYSQGIQCLLTGLKYQKNPKVVSCSKDKVRKYLKRAQDIKASNPEADCRKTREKSQLTAVSSSIKIQAAHMCSDFPEWEDYYQQTQMIVAGSVRESQSELCMIVPDLVESMILSFYWIMPNIVRFPTCTREASNVMCDDVV